jgi:hypothetical protein
MYVDLYPREIFKDVPQIIWRPEFDPRNDHMGFKVDTVSLWKKYFGFPHQLSLNRRLHNHYLIIISLTLYSSESDGVVK